MAMRKVKRGVAEMDQAAQHRPADRKIQMKGKNHVPTATVIPTGINVADADARDPEDQIIPIILIPPIIPIPPISQTKCEEVKK